MEPTRALTTGLVATYTAINDKYYAVLGTRKKLSERTPPSSPPRSRDRRASETSATEAWASPSRRRELVNPREVAHERYLLDKVLGSGSFGKVVLAYDLADDKHVAIKVIERTRRTETTVRQEIDFLREINDGPNGGDEDSSSESNVDHHSRRVRGRETCVRLLDVFTHLPEKENGGFQCLVFEIMSHSLYDLLRVTNLRGVSIKLVRKLSVQILYALEYIGSFGIIHCDIKQENVLLCHPERSAVKLIDFGSACKCGKKQFSYVQSRFYRAPEVILGMEYGRGIDMWSAGCMFYELRAGTPLFMGWSEHDQLCKMEATLGKFPSLMYNKIPMEYCKRYFDERGMTKPSPEVLRAAKKSDTQVPEPGSRPLAKVLHKDLTKHASDTDVRPRQDHGEGGLMHSAEHERKMREAASVVDDSTAAENEILLSLISRMVALDPARRITPEQALAHPFFYPVAGKMGIEGSINVNALQKRLSSIPDMSGVDALNLRESNVSAGIGRRFTFDSQTG